MRRHMPTHETYSIWHRHAHTYAHTCAHMQLCSCCTQVCKMMAYRIPSCFLCAPKVRLAATFSLWYIGRQGEGMILMLLRAEAEDAGAHADGKKQSVTTINSEKMGSCHCHCLLVCNLTSVCSLPTHSYSASLCHGGEHVRV